MATIVKPTPTEQREKNLNIKTKLPRDRYAVRFISEEFEISKIKADTGLGGNPMIVLKGEIVAPDVIKNPVDGSLLNIAGTELKPQYFSLRVRNKDGTQNEESSKKAFDRYSDLRTLLGVPIDENEGIDVENPPKVFKGIVADCVCDSQVVSQRKDPTPEQRAKNQLGDVIKDASGKELNLYFPYIVDILGLADASAVSSAANKPY